MAEREIATARRVRWWHLLAPVAAVPAVLAGIGAVLSLAIQSASERGYGTQLSELMFASDTRFVFAQVVLAIFYIAFLVVLSLLLGRVGATRMVADYADARATQIVFGAILGVVLAGASMALVAWLAAGGVDFKPNAAEAEIMPDNFGELLMAIASIVIIGPYAEELYFRGALLSWMRDKIGLALAIVVSSAIFGAVHLQFVIFPGAQGWILTGVITAIGVVNGLWAARTGSLWPAFSTHAGFNGAMLAAGMIAPDAG